MTVSADKFNCVMRDGLARILNHGSRETGAPFALYWRLARLCYGERTATIRTTTNEVRRAMGRTRPHRQFTRALDPLRELGLVVTTHHARYGMTYHLPMLVELYGTGRMKAYSEAEV